MHHLFGFLVWFVLFGPISFARMVSMYFDEDIGPGGWCDEDYSNAINSPRVLNIEEDLCYPISKLPSVWPNTWGDYWFKIKCNDQTPTTQTPGPHYGFVGNVDFQYWTGLGIDGSLCAGQPNNHTFLQHQCTPISSLESFGYGAMTIVCEPEGDSFSAFSSSCVASQVISYAYDAPPELSGFDGARLSNGRGIMTDSTDPSFCAKPGFSFNTDQGYAAITMYLESTTNIKDIQVQSCGFDGRSFGQIDYVLWDENSTKVKENTLMYDLPSQRDLAFVKIPIGAIGSRVMLTFWPATLNDNGTNATYNEVFVEEISICREAQPSVTVMDTGWGLDWSDCNAVCGLRYYQNYPFFCADDRSLYSLDKCTDYDPDVHITKKMCYVDGSFSQHYSQLCIENYAAIQEVQAIGGPSSVKLSWNPIPNPDIIQWIISYREYSDVDGFQIGSSEQCWSFQRKCKVFDVQPSNPLYIGLDQQGWDVSDLTNGDTFQFQILVRNKDNLLSSPVLSNFVQPRDVDTVDVSKEDLTPGNGQVTVSFNVPTYHGDSNIATYLIRVDCMNRNRLDIACDGKNVTYHNATGSPKTITGLKNGVLWMFRIQYTNEDGISSTLGVGDSTTPRGELLWNKPQDTCSGTCGFGTIGQYGTVVPECVDTDGVDYYTSICDQNLEKDDSCQRICPPAPEGVKVVEIFSGAVTISWDVAQSPEDIKEDPVTWYYLVANFGKSDSLYVQTNLTEATIQGLTDGKKYSFQVRSMTSKWIMSELSKSVDATPTNKNNCFGGCSEEGGRCDNGICWCWYGYHGAQCNEKWKLKINSPTQNEVKDLRLVYDEEETPTGALGYDWTIKFIMYKNETYNEETRDKFQNMDSKLEPDVLLFDKTECEERGDKFCLPKEQLFRGEYTLTSEGPVWTGTASFQMSYLTYPQLTDFDPPTYSAMVFASPTFSATTTADITLEYNPLFCVGNFDDEKRTCTAEGQVKENSRCDENNAKCVCYYGYKEDENGVCVEENECQGKCGVFGDCEENGKCKCKEGFRGEYCNIGPNCNLKCQHEGYPELNSNGLPPADCKDTECVCPGDWEGDRCEKCGIACANGGKPDKDCNQCKCPKWFSVTNDESNRYGDQWCRQEYLEISFILNIKEDSYLLGTERTGSSDLLNAVRETTDHIFDNAGISNVYCRSAASRGGKVAILCSLKRTTTSASTVKMFQLLVENVKSPWYEHYLTAQTDPASFSVDQRENAQSEISYASVTIIIRHFACLTMLIGFFWF